jgi:tetratricopeptide (TPR) repeat protein
VALLNGLSTASTRPEYQHLLALCYLEGATAREEGDQPGKGGGERAIDVLERLVQSVPEDLDYAFDLSEAYARIQVPRPPIAPETRNLIEDRFSKGLALLDKLVARNPDIPDFLAARARLRGKLGAYYRQVEQWPEAEARFHQAIADQKELVKQFPTAPYYRVWMANFSIALADALIRQNRATEARTELEQTLALLEQVLDKSPGMPRPHDLLALGYSKLAAAARQTGDKEKADEATRKAEQERAAARRTP